jgi:hypothetical protein
MRRCRLDVRRDSGRPAIPRLDGTLEGPDQQSSAIGAESDAREFPVAARRNKQGSAGFGIPNTQTLVLSDCRDSETVGADPHPSAGRTYPGY